MFTDSHGDVIPGRVLLLGENPVGVIDDDFVATWVDMISSELDT